MNDKETSRDELISEIRSLRMENSRLNKIIFDLAPMEEIGPLLHQQLDKKAVNKEGTC